MQIFHFEVFTLYLITEEKSSVYIQEQLLNIFCIMECRCTVEVRTSIVDDNYKMLNIIFKFSFASTWFLA